MKCIVSIILRNEFSLAVWSLAQPLGITINSVSWYLSRLVWGHIAQHSSESWTLTLQRAESYSSDYERAATRTIRNGHSSWRDLVWIKTQICITQLTSCPAAISAQYLQNFIKSSDRQESMSKKFVGFQTSDTQARLDIWYASKAITAARKYRQPAQRRIFIITWFCLVSVSHQDLPHTPPEWAEWQKSRP